MIDAIAFLAYLAQAEHELPASIAPWLSILTGSGGALAVLGLWVKNLLAEKAAMIEAHRKKDEDLLEITRDAIACISSSVAQHKLDGEFRIRLEDLLKKIEDRLPD